MNRDTCNVVSLQSDYDWRVCWCILDIILFSHNLASLVCFQMRSFRPRMSQNQWRRQVLQVEGANIWGPVDGPKVPSEAQSAVAPIGGRVWGGAP